jgi:hypothetical protein
MVISNRIPAVPRNRKLFVPNPSAEEKKLGIPFQTLQRKRKQLGIPFPETKIEANSQNSFRTLQRKRIQLGIPFSGAKYKQTLGIPFLTNSRKIKLLRVECRGRQRDQRSCPIAV